MKTVYTAGSDSGSKHSFVFVFTTSSDQGFEITLGRFTLIFTLIFEFSLLNKSFERVSGSKMPLTSQKLTFGLQPPTFRETF